LQECPGVFLDLLSMLAEPEPEMIPLFDPVPHCTRDVLIGVDSVEEFHSSIVGTVDDQTRTPDLLERKMRELEVLSYIVLVPLFLLIPIRFLCGKIKERNICSYTMWKGMNSINGTSNHPSGLASVSG